MPGLIRFLWLPPWRRAPLRTLRNPSLFFGVAVAAFVLGVAGGSRPMLASSASTETLRRDLEVGCRFEVGLEVGRQVSVGDPAPGTGQIEGPVVINAAQVQVDAATTALNDAVGTLPGIGRPVVTVRGGTGILAGSESAVLVALVARTGAEDHIQVVEGAPGPGIWLPDVVAENLGAGPGDQVDLDLGGTSTRLPVAGVFRDLRAGRDRHWCSLHHLFESPTGTNPPPPVVLFDQDRLLSVLAGAGLPEAFASWEYAPTGHDWFLHRARASIGSLKLIADRTNNFADPLARLLLVGESHADVVGSVRRAERTATAVDAMAAPIALGTVGVAVVMLLAAARSWLQRESQEITVLALRGAGPSALAVKAILELLVPMVLGAAVGLAGAVVLIRTVGPSPNMETSAIGDGTRFVAVTLLAALGAAGIVVAAGARRVGLSVGGAVAAARRWWWELVVLALAGAAFYELRTRQGLVVDDTSVDALLLLFPLLLLVGGAGLLARVLLAARPLAWIATRLPAAAWLAVRRLIAARTRAGLIVTGAALAVGIVVFAGALSASLRATAYAKMVLGPGSAQVLRLVEPMAEIDDPALRGLHTMVTRTSEFGVIRRGHERVDVLGVEPETFADAAFWDPSFADRSLPDLLELLDTPPEGDIVPAIAVGAGLPDRFVLTLPGADQADHEDHDVAVEVALADRVAAFPGYRFQADRPLVVVNRELLTRRGVLEHAEIWIDDPSPAIGERLAAAGAPILFTMRPAESDERSLLQPQTWATAYLEVVGLVAGLVTVAALGLYFAANARRRQLGSALARQLGLRAWRGAAATAIEVGGILAAGFVFGTTLAWFAARLVFRELDPLPNSPPAAIFRLDLPVVVLCGLGTLLTSMVATAVIEHRAARASLPELLRNGR